jgi:hypothetical protein
MRVEKAGSGSLRWHVVDDAGKLVRRFRTKRSATLCVRVWGGDESAIDAMAASVLKEHHDSTATGVLMREHDRRFYQAPTLETMT